MKTKIKSKSKKKPKTNFSKQILKTIFHLLKRKTKIKFLILLIILVLRNLFLKRKEKSIYLFDFSTNLLMYQYWASFVWKITCYAFDLGVDAFFFDVFFDFFCGGNICSHFWGDSLLHPSFKWESKWMSIILEGHFKHFTSNFFLMFSVFILSKRNFSSSQSGHFLFSGRCSLQKMEHLFLHS